MADAHSLAECRLSAPRETGVTGCFCPFRFDDDTQPVFVTMPDVAEMFVPIFTTRERLDAEMERIGVLHYTPKFITDGPDFVSSVIGAGARIMLDPRPEGGRTCWTEIVLDGMPLPGDNLTGRGVGGAPS